MAIMPTDPNRKALFAAGPRSRVQIPFLISVGRRAVWLAKGTAWAGLSAVVLALAFIAIRGLWWAFGLLIQSIGA